MACGAGCGGNGGCGSGGCGSGAGGCASGCGTGEGCPALHVFDWLDDVGTRTATTALVEVTFKGARREVYRNARGLDVQTGDFVIVQADRGMDFGTVHMTGELVRLRLKQRGLDPAGDFPAVMRAATLGDVERWEQNKEREAETFYVGREAIARRRLPMKLVDVEWQFDHNKVTFYFTADHRVDFRALVRDLAGHFRTRVELRQIGARDEAARLGGIGSCGRELCCSTWLQEFKPVSTRAARVQHLPLNPTRLSGQCGRLKCCLNYELEQYMELLRAYPRLETAVETEQGRATVQKLDIFRERVWLRMPDRSLEEVPLARVRDLLGIPEGRPARR